MEGSRVITTIKFHEELVREYKRIIQASQDIHVKTYPPFRKRYVEYAHGFSYVRTFSRRRFLPRLNVPLEAR